MRLILLSISCISCFYYESFGNLLPRFQADDSCETSNFPKPPCCGIGKESTYRIINGTSAKIEEFPWMVNLDICGGSLINSQWVLTAAHCIHDDYPDLAYLGAEKCDADYGCEEKATAIKISKRIMHEKWVPEFKNNDFDDIALVKLEEPVTFSDTIKPICLPTASFDERLDGRKAIVSGWGDTTGFQEYSPELLKTTVELWSSKRCDDYDNKNRSKYQICAGRADNDNSACSGDSGGPLFLRSNDKKNTAFYQIGVVSAGLHLTDDFDKSRICHFSTQIYAKVRNYMEWIEKTISEN